MNAISILLTTWTLWAFNFGHCSLTTFGRVTTVGQKINNRNDSNSTDDLFSPHFRKVIVGIYKQSFDNFKELVHLSEISDDVNFKADVLLGLYDAMSEAHHTDIPSHALDLYNKTEALFNGNSTSLNSEKSTELQDILQELLLNTIVPKGSRILESAVYVKGCNLEGTPFEKLLKMLLTTNQTVANLTFGAMVARARWTLPIAELTPILADFSSNIKQNVDLLLSLNDEGPFEEAEQRIIAEQLAKLKGELKQTEKITAGSAHKIPQENAPLEIQLTILFYGDICLYQELPTGLRRYIYECSENDLHMCTHEHQHSQRIAVFTTELTLNAHVYKFYSPSPDAYNRTLSVNPASKKEYQNLKYNVYSSPAYRASFPEWKVQIEGEQVVLQNTQSFSFMCAGNEHSNYVYSRNFGSFLSHKEECKWFVEDCSDANKSINLYEENI